jgi:hypothetical protein
MAHLFKYFPKVSYDIKKNKKPLELTNVMLRFKITQALNTRAAIYYNYTVEEGESASMIADKLYGDSRLDWLIFMINDVVDPLYDWPLGGIELNEFVRSKYGSVSVAQQTVHHYEKIINESTIVDGEIIVPKRTVKVDLTTYNSLAPSERRSVDQYTYEVERNDAKRQIKLLDANFISQITNEVKNVLR